MPSLPSGVRLRNRYIIRRELGQGGFGRIYLVEDAGRFSEQFVIKEFLSSARGTATVQKDVELFQQEAQILYQLQHPQIPRFWEFFQEGARLFVVQDFIEGQTYLALLEKRLRSGNCFSEAEIIKFFRDLLPVLSYLHGLGIVHRDIAPDNIILSTKTGLPVLIDLGAAKQAVINATIAAPPHAQRGASIGKTGYAPDEQIRLGIFAPHSDLYALAVTALVLMTGKQPQELFDQQTLGWHWEQKIRLSLPLAQLLKTMLHPQPDKRFQSAEQILQILSTLAIPSENTPVLLPSSVNLFASPNLRSPTVPLTPTVRSPSPSPTLMVVSSVEHRSDAVANSPQWVLERIQVVKDQRLKELDLSSGELKEIPIEVFELEWLETLYLSSNYLTSVPDQISQLQSLKTLDLSRNALIEIPKNFTDLNKLTSLYLSFNNIIEIPETITNLNDLIRLNLSDNLLTHESCYALAHMQNLTFLDLSHNQLTRLPKSICNLHGITSLDLSYNYLAELPKEFIALKNLNTLNLEFNAFKEIPEPIYELPFLNSLSFSNKEITTIPNFQEIDQRQIRRMTEKYKESYKSHTSRNQICEVPISILKLTKLRYLDVDSNPISKPPYEVTEKGVEEIRQYYRQLETEGKDYIYEAKLLVVGEGGAGKTTLVKKIQASDYPLQEEDSTQGIEVIKWNLTLSNGRVFRVNIWDFGGQEIYHATHQFFLTKRSLYVLVVDTRREDTDFYYWLNTVRLFSENSPLLIIKNEKQDRQREIPENQLRGQFGNLKETISTNLATNRGLLDILRNIEYYITTLPHVGTALPKTWVSVRAALENDSRNYLSLEEYLNICQQHGFTQLEDKLQLSGYLHDLGVILHFQDDPILNNIVILKPSWGTDAAYKILDDERVKKKFGHFNWSDLTNIWRNKQYTNKQGELLQLMCKFKLCYEIPGQPGFYIVPQLLTENQLKYEWDEANNLMLRYTYEFMPKGILTQFIVAMHELIDQQRYVWKSGVILNTENTKAEIIEFYGKREIRVRVSGLYKRDLMTIVVHHLDRIHDSYKQLKYQKLIPCNCSTCKTNQNPYFYEFKKLRERIANQKQTVECGNPPYLSVSVVSLIDDVLAWRQEHGTEQRGSGGISSSAVLSIGSVENLVYRSEDNRPMNNINQFHSGSGDNIARDKNTTSIYNSQNLAQAAGDIKALLDQLSQNYSNTAIVGAKAIEEIDRNPTLKQRVINALKEAGAEALEKAVDHPAVSIVVAGAKGFMDA